MTRRPLPPLVEEWLDEIERLEQRMGWPLADAIATREELEREWWNTLQGQAWALRLDLLALAHEFRTANRLTASVEQLALFLLEHRWILRALVFVVLSMLVFAEFRK